MQTKVTQRSTINISGALYSENKLPYAQILTAMQAHMKDTYARELTSFNGESEAEHFLRECIQKSLKEKRIGCDDETDMQQLTDRLFHDMSEFSFISRLDLFNLDGFEELNGNAWNDIELITDKGYKKLKETFLSPRHAMDIITRILSRRGVTMDESLPFAYGDIGKGIRIAVMMSPIVDEEVGIAFSIRKVNTDTISKNKLIEKGSAAEEELRLLQVLAERKISMAFGGGTGSGKTTSAAWLLSTLPLKYRIFTIEEGSREVNLVRYNEKREIISRVIHTLTKTSANPQDVIDQTRLLELALRFDPDVIFMAEMRSREAFAVQEAARTGHGVLATLHTKSAPATYMRLMTLAKQAQPTFNDDTLMKMMIEAFPIIIYQKQLDDGSRRIMRIIEAERYKEGEIIYRTLWRFVVEDTVTDDEGFSRIEGHHERVASISDALYDELIENGCPRHIADHFHKPTKEAYN